MNLNKFLCSKFEPNKDGKVTIGHVADIVLKTSIIGVVLSLITIWLGGVLIYLFETVGIISESDLPQYIVDGEVIASCIFFFLAGLLSVLLVFVIAAVIVLAGYIIDGICSIPIASCPVSKEKNDDHKLIEGKKEKNDDHKLIEGKKEEGEDLANFNKEVMENIK